MVDAKNIDNRYVISSSHANHRKYEKFLVTIALRLGIEVKDPDDIILDFKGSFSESNKEHNSNNYIGSLVVNGQEFTKTQVKICTPSYNHHAIRTLWPVFNDNLGSQHKKHVQTEEFIDEYGSGRMNLTIGELATYYHELFLIDPFRSPLNMALEVNGMQDAIRRKMNKSKVDEVTAEFQKKEKEAQEDFKNREKQIKAEYKKREKELEESHQENLKRVIAENQANKGAPNQATKNNNLDVDWSSSTINSAVFNYYKEQGDYLCVFINDEATPIKLKRSTWGDRYPKALNNIQRLQKGEVFEYITQGINKFSPQEWFSKIIPLSKNTSESKQFEEHTDASNLGTTYILTRQIISDLNNTKYTFRKTFNVKSTFLVAGEEFRKHYGFPWSRPMTLIETDVGWFIDAASNSSGVTKWTPGEHQNCKISLTKGKHLPYWLEK